MRRANKDNLRLRGRLHPECLHVFLFLRHYGLPVRISSDEVTFVILIRTGSPMSSKIKHSLQTLRYKQPLSLFYYPVALNYSIELQPITTFYYIICNKSITKQADRWCRRRVNSVNGFVVWMLWWRDQIDSWCGPYNAIRRYGRFRFLCNGRFCNLRYSGCS